MYQTPLEHGEMALKHEASTPKYVLVTMMVEATMGPRHWGVRNRHGMIGWCPA